MAMALLSVNCGGYIIMHQHQTTPGHLPNNCLGDPNPCPKQQINFSQMVSHT